MIKKYQITKLFLILALATSCSIPYTTQPDLIRKIEPSVSPTPQKIEIKKLKLLPFRKYIETKNGTKFFIDSSTQRILKIDKNGITTVFAGGGTEKTLSNSQKATDISFEALADMQFFNYEEPNADNKKGDNVLYVLDSTKNQVLRIDENGTITKVIGSGQKSLDNKNTTQNNASLNSPTSIALDKKGNVFIADSGNNQIKKVSNDVILVLDPSTQNQPIKRFFESPVLEIIAGTLLTTPNSQKAIENKLTNPTALVIDNNGNVIISDTGNNQIKKIDKNGNISVIAGSTNNSIDKKLDLPLGLTLDNNGNILFIESGSNQIKKIDDSGILTTLLDVPKPNSTKNSDNVIVLDNNDITNSLITSINFYDNGKLIVNNSSLNPNIFVKENIYDNSKIDVLTVNTLILPIKIEPKPTSTPTPTPTPTPSTSSNNSSSGGSSNPTQPTVNKDVDVNVDIDVEVSTN